jgi:hypothetical protein
MPPKWEMAIGVSWSRLSYLKIKINMKGKRDNYYIFCFIAKVLPMKSLDKNMVWTKIRIMHLHRMSTIFEEYLKRTN